MPECDSRENQRRSSDAISSASGSCSRAAASARHEVADQPCIIYTELAMNWAEEPLVAASLNIQTIVSAPFDENTYVVWQPKAREAIVFDPGLEPDLILDFLRDQDLRVAAI